MGEIAVSKTPGDVLVAIGLGSCIGLALLDTERRVAGLAHVMLPRSGGAKREPDARGKFADLAVPALVERLTALGARRSRLEAVLVGGARMFTFASPTLDVGARNEEATLEALRRAGIRVVARETSGSVGRTIRVHVDGRVVCKTAGGAEQSLIGEAA